MNIALWAVQIILGLMFLFAGSTKAFSYEKAKASMPWVQESSKGLVVFIGLAEVLGAIGLILPYALGIAPILTPIAAIGIADYHDLGCWVSYQEEGKSSNRDEYYIISISTICRNRTLLGGVVDGTVFIHWPWITIFSCTTK